jgi:hypothetical protein
LHPEKKGGGYEKQTGKREKSVGGIRYGRFVKSNHETFLGRSSFSSILDERGAP